MGSRGMGQKFPGMRVCAVDLQDGLDVGIASHDDYRRVVVERARSLPAPVALCGWSMGGLVVLQAAQTLTPHSVTLVEASPPAEVQGFDRSADVTDGVFDPEAVYGLFPAEIPARSESSRARAERKRGISVPRLPCPSLVIYGDNFPEERGREIARLYGSDEHHFPGFDHWQLVRNRHVAGYIAQWLGTPGRA